MQELCNGTTPWYSLVRNRSVGLAQIIAYTGELVPNILVRVLPAKARSTGSIPVGTTRNAEVSSCLVGWSPLAIAFIRQNPPWVDLPLDYLKVRRGTGTVPHLTCGHRRRLETVESGVGDGGGGVVNELGYETRRHCRGGVRRGAMA